MTQLEYRRITEVDVPEVARSRLSDPAAGRGDERMAAYMAGRHHPQQALPLRMGFAAFDGPAAVGYLAGHLTRRFDCNGELQYLFVAPTYRRAGVATRLVRELFAWFIEQKALRVCVNVDADSPSARPFYQYLGAVELRPHWLVWPDVRRVVRSKGGHESNYE